MQVRTAKSGIDLRKIILSILIKKIHIQRAVKFQHLDHFFYKFKKSGILKGYPVPQMTLIQQGVEREYRNVYLAVSEEEIAGEEIPMLLPPALLQETNKARRKKEKIKEPDDPARHNVADRSKYGLKDSNTGKNAV
mgnify:CR=1 FL=1